MKKVGLFVVMLILSMFSYSDDRIIVMPDTGHYQVIDLKYNEPLYLTKGAAIVILPNNQVAVLYNYKEVEEYKKIKEAAIFSETFKAKIGSVSDLTANAFIIKYEELGGKYKLKEIDVECSN